MVNISQLHFQMTGHSFIVYGLLMDSKWMVKGLENLGEAIEEMQLQLRLNVDSIGLKIFAYKASPMCFLFRTQS